MTLKTTMAVITRKMVIVACLLMQHKNIQPEKKGKTNKIKT